MIEDIGKVAVLMGGLSAEREVSLKSGGRIVEGLRAEGVDALGLDADRDVMRRLHELKAERAFIALHGRWGEDGVIQGALEVAGIPYTGSGVLGCALAIDKLRTKLMWRGAGIPTPEYRVINGEDDLATAVSDLGLPLFVKPSLEGSSIGITKVESQATFVQAWRAAREYDSTVLAEKFIDGPELTIGVLGNEALPTIRLETPRTFYDYVAKYEADTTLYHCPSGLADDLDTALQRQALQAFEVLGCTGWGRVDLMLDGADRPYFLEVNTVPGMTDHSLVPMAARARGMDFNQLVRRILELSL